MHGRKMALNLLLGLVGLAAGCDGAGQSSQPTAVRTLGFEACVVGQAPPDFAVAMTGSGGPASWVVVVDPASGSKKVLAQTSSDATKYRFPVCVYERLVARDVAVSVRFKAISGKVDQAGGVVVRYQDKDNYYIVRANALEDNVRLYKVEQGKRIQIAGLDTKVTPGQWHTLSLAAHGNHLVATFDGQRFEADDATFSRFGLAGLWTKADSVTYFDDLKIASHDKP